jgi:hypothetical protein
MVSREKHAIVLPDIVMCIHADSSMNRRAFS